MHLGQKKPGRIALTVALTLAATSAARADITTSFSGFGTAGGSFTSDSNFAYRHDASEFTPATNQFDISLESRLGLQGTVDFGSGFSITGQEVFRERGSNEFDPGTEWLYVQYAPNSDWQIRMGRVVLPVFLFSDSRQVGFAQPWFRSPQEVYDQFPFDFLDGGQITWQKSLGKLNISLQATTGTTNGTFQDGSISIVTNAHDIFNESISVTYGDFLFRLAQTTFTVPNEIPLTSTYTLSWQEHETLVTAGAQYDNGRAVVIGEFSKTKQNFIPQFGEPLTESTAWYLAGGWRFGKFLPLVTYGHVYEEQSLLSAPYSKASWSANLRYDVVSNIAIKAEVSEAKANNGLYFAAPDLTSNKSIYVYSLGVDFVF
jgi:Gram-negative porin